MFPSNLAPVLACQLASRTASRAVAGAPWNSRPFPRPAQLGALRWCARVGSLLVPRDGAWAWLRTHHRAHVHSCACDAVQWHPYGTTRSYSRASWWQTVLLPTRAGMRGHSLAASFENALYGSLGGSHVGMHVASPVGARCHSRGDRSGSTQPVSLNIARAARRGSTRLATPASMRHRTPAAVQVRTRVGLCACPTSVLARIRGNLRNMLDRTTLARVLAIHNGKGGAIKTSIATNLAGIVAEAGYRVLLVDLDPQGNCGEDLGYTDQADDGELLRTALEAGSPLRPTLVARERLDVAAGGPALRDIKVRPGQNVFDMLAASLIPQAEDYDLVILDTPPGGSSTIDMALGAARYLIIPSPPDRSSIKGLEFVAQSIEEARRDNPMLTLLGALLVQVASNATTIRSNALDGLTQSLGDPSLMFRTSIRYAAKTAQEARDRGMLSHELAALQQGRPFWEFLKSGQKVPDRVQSAPGLASDYVSMTDEVLERIYDEEKRLAAFEEEQQ